MTPLDPWLPGRVSWLVRPTILGNTLTVALAGPWGLAVERFEPAALQVLLLLAVALTAGLQLAFASLALGRLHTFRGLVAGRLPPSAAHRLTALGELRRFPSHAAALSLAGWVLGSFLLGLGVASLADVQALVAARLAVIGVLFSPLAALMVSVGVTARAHEASDRLSEGLPPHDVIAAAPGIAWSLRGRAVGFTAGLTVLPILLLCVIAWAEFARAPSVLAALDPGQRLAGAEALVSQLTWRLWGLGALAVAFAVVAAGAAGQVVARPMQRLAAEAGRIAAGHLEHPRVIAADGEVWRVTGVFAQLHERLAALVDKVAAAGSQVHDATAALQRTSARSNDTAAEQATALNQTSETTEELACSAQQIAASAGAVQDLARRTLEAAREGHDDAATFQAAVDRMKQDNRSIASAVERLQRRVQQIGRIVELINAVADRSDLLALSAELEGTRAGEVGRGFSLVGAEMRRLAENVLESTAEVEELIAEIREATQRTAEATERGSTLTARGTALADDVTASLVQVAELAEATAEQVRTITLSTQQQQSGTDQLAEVMADILSSTQLELQASQRVVEVNRRLLELSTSLQGAVGRFTGAKGGR